MFLFTMVVLALSGNESGEDEGQEEGLGASLNVQQERLEAEKQAILQNKGLVDEVNVLVILVSYWVRNL